MNSDLISRSALIETINKISFYSVHNGEFIEGAGLKDVAYYRERDIYRAIIDAPTVERPKGKWIKQDNGYIMCPFCKTGTKHGAWWEYCPKCGANMVVDLCSICKHGDNCERSDKGISFANHSSCWKFER